MTEQPEALRLAEISPYLEHSERSSWNMAVCAELRRLHEVNAALLEALEQMLACHGEQDCPALDVARAAIAKAEAAS